MMKFAVFVLFAGVVMATPNTEALNRPLSDSTNSNDVKLPPTPSHYDLPYTTTKAPFVRSRRQASPFGWVIPPPPPPMPQINPHIPLSWQIQPPSKQLLRPWGGKIEGTNIQNRWEGTSSLLNDMNLKNSESVFNPVRPYNGQVVWSPASPWMNNPQQPGFWGPSQFSGPVLVRGPLHGVYFD